MIIDNKLENIKSFKTTWTVPFPPSVNIQTNDGTSDFYICNGLGLGGLQAGVHWNSKNWCYYLQNWAGGNGYVVNSPCIKIESGAEVTGLITLKEVKNGKWTYGISFIGHPDLDVVLTNDKQINGVMLGYFHYVDDLKRGTGSTYCKMKNICLDLTPGSPPMPAEFNWRVMGPPLHTPSGNNIVIVKNHTTNGEIDFYFQ